MYMFFVCFKQKTAYEMRISDWSSDVCSSDLRVAVATYEKAVQTAFREVSDALAQRGRIGDQIRAQTTRAEAAGVAARLSDARFRSGVDSFLVTLDAQRTAYGAEQALVTTRLTQASNLVELYRSLGGGLADEPLHGEARNGEIDTSGAP